MPGLLKEENAYLPRFYRDVTGERDLKIFRACYKESDLWVGINYRLFNKEVEIFIKERLIEIRKELDAYINLRKDFADSFEPVILNNNSPAIAKIMADASAIAGTGPMSAVAGAIAETIGKEVQQKFGIDEIIVENGGDLYIDIRKPYVVVIHAGYSPMSDKMGLVIPAGITPLGICTSSGKFGRSLNLGSADSVTIACRDTALADAYATAFGNMVKTNDDFEPVMEKIKAKQEIVSAVIINDEKIEVSGKLEIRMLR